MDFRNELLKLGIILTEDMASKFDEYYPALDEYTKTNKADKLTELFANLLIEALYRRIRSHQEFCLQNVSSARFRPCQDSCVC